MDGPDQRYVLPAGPTDDVQYTGTYSLSVTGGGSSQVPTLMVDIPQTSISENGGTAQATVTRNTANTNALVVNLSSSDATEATVLPQVTIPVGLSAVTFTVTAQNDTVADRGETVTITASAAGYTSIGDTLQVLDDDGGGGGGTTDDHGNSSSAATSVSVPSTTSGVIEVNTDTDWFRFVANAGTQYTLQTTLGTLRDSWLTLYGTNGTTVLAENDDIANGVLASRIQWTAPASGTYYAAVRPYNQSYTGTYTLSVSTGSGSIDGGSAAEAQANLDALFQAFGQEGAAGSAVDGGSAVDEKLLEAVAQAVAGNEPAA